jgi:hypothetical protein
MESVDIEGYEGIYKIFDDGRVWVYPRRSNPGMFMKTQVRVKRKDRIKPYLYEYIGFEKLGIHKKYAISRLVATAFIPNPENKPQVNHKDGNRLNNNVSNLEWVTSSENMQHSKESGFSYFLSEKQKETRINNGKSTGAINGKKARRLFSYGEAIEIRKIALSNLFSNRKIASIYGCCSRVIDKIKNNQSYCTP